MSLGRTFFLTALSVGLAAVLAFCLILLVSEQAPSGTPIASTVLVLQTSALCAGDANLDGLRDVRDLVLVQAHILKQKTLGAQALSNADANQDAQVDVRDIVALLQHSLGERALPACDIAFPDEAPSIRFISPGTGPAGTSFTLIGRNFSPIAAQNTVLFFRPGTTLQASVNGASADRIHAVVPEEADSDLYRVTVTVNGRESNGPGFQVRASLPRLELIPSSSSVLLPPGSGKETLVIGGGTPPYFLKPLEETEQEILQAELDGSVIEVTGFKVGGVRLMVEDSALIPAADSSAVTVRETHFEPSFDIIPHTLLAGSTPGFTVILRHFSNHLRPVKTELRFDNVQTDFSLISEGSALGLGRQIFIGLPREFQALIATDVSSPDRIAFEGFNVIDDELVLQVRGFLESGSAVISMESAFPTPPESLFPISSTQEIILGDRMFRLPQAAGETFEITATFTSTTARAGEDFPLTHTSTGDLNPTFFQTVAPPPGAPRAESLLPVLGSVGQLVRILGSGFDADPAKNTVTFQTESIGRIEAAVETASPTELTVRVPLEAITGAVQVTVNGLTSNDHQFFVLFRPEAGIFFPEFRAGQPVAPLLFVRQWRSPRFQLVLDHPDVGFDSLQVVLDQGSIKTDTLEVGQPAGSAGSILHASGTAPSDILTDYLLVYAGQEEEGERRHFFDLKKTLEASDSDGTLYMWEGDGVRFEFSGLVSLLGRTWTILLDEAVYVPPDASGVLVDATAEVHSVPWNFIPDTQMVVVFPAQVITE